MKFIILCGGVGKRCNNYSFPKPLNFINGRHLIEYIVEGIPSNEIYIIYNILLDDYNFQEILINKFKNIKFHFSTIDFLTRGAVETAFIGIDKLSINSFQEDNILFIDNDNYHKLNDTLQGFPKTFNKNFIGYGIDYTKDNFSFITIHNENVVNIAEKQKISDYYCCGLYGFKNVSEFKKLAEELILKNNKTKNEFYFSQLYKLLIEKNELIEPFHVKNTIHLGSYDEAILNNHLIEKKKLRVCFDLDNTLVSCPTIPNDYTSVKPIIKNIDFLKTLKSEGHDIIIYTARRMATCGGNLGKVMKDVALITLKTLEELEIPYDEIIFGKPIADIYIDDRAYNPYINSSSVFGIFHQEDDKIINKIENNRYNKICKKNGIICKVGPSQYMKGELYFYQNVEDIFQKYFPKLLDYNKIEDSIELKLEYIEGIPLYFLYKSKTYTTFITDKLFSILKEFHKVENINIKFENIKNNYIEKLKKRFNKNDYYFSDADEVFNKIIKDLEVNIEKSKTVGMIHGDCWFSNIILGYDDHLKFLDMKGQVDDILTLNGDIYYDYGKLYQSILGYDLILHRNNCNREYLQYHKEYFLEKCKEIGLDIEYLKIITKSLIFGSFVFLRIDDPKEEIWEFLKSI